MFFYYVTKWCSDQMSLVIRVVVLSISQQPTKSTDPPHSVERLRGKQLSGSVSLHLLESMRFVFLILNNKCSFI